MMVMTATTNYNEGDDSQSNCNVDDDYLTMI
jgi:hypothetical protein